MKRIAAIVFIGAFLAHAVRVGFSESLAEWFTKPGGSPPVITQWFAAKKVSIPLVLSHLTKQESPPSPFNIGGLDKLGIVVFDLVNPRWDDGVERVP